MRAPQEKDALLSCDKKDKTTTQELQNFVLTWKTPAVFGFVVLGAGQAIATRASVNRDGQLPYDTAAAVCWAEILKLVFAIFWAVAFNRGTMSQVPRKVWITETVELSAIAALFALQNELNFLIIEKLGAGLFMILGNLKIVFTCIFMSVLLGKRFANLQWFGVILLTLSAIVVKVPQLADMFKHGASATQGLSIVGLGLLLISTASSGLASVTNELILKRGAGNASEDPQIPFMLKNGILYVWGVGLNLFSWATWGKHSFAAPFTSMGIASILCLAGVGLSCAIILRYLDNVVRCFSCVSQVLMTVLLSQMLYLNEGALDKYYVASLVLLAVSLIVYQAHDSPNLYTYMFVAGCGALATGYGVTLFAA